MPKPPLFTSERTRSAVIAVAMVVLLAVTLALAYALSVRPGPSWGDLALESEPRRIGELELLIPTHWRDFNNDPRHDSFQLAHAWADPQDAARRLFVGLIVFNTPRSPTDALDVAVYSVMEPSDHPSIHAMVKPRSLRVGPLTGLLFGDAVQTDGGDEERFLAVLTLDGRRYWVICYNQMVQAGMFRKQGMLSDTLFFEKLCHGAVDRSRRGATVDDYRRLGLPTGSQGPALPEGLIAQTVQGGADDPIELAPRDGVNGLEFIRIRGTIDAGINDPASSLSPQGLLSSYFLDTLGRRPTAKDVVQSNAGDVIAWHTTLGAGTAMLVHDLWYVRIGGGRALLVETLSEPRAAASAAEAMPDVIAAFAPTPQASELAPTTEPAPTTAPATQPSLDPPFREAVRRGIELAGRVNAGLQDTLVAGWTHYLITSEDGQKIGYQITQVASPQKGDPLPLRGGSHLDLPTTHWQRDVEWAIDPSGARFEQFTRQLVPLPNTSKAELTVRRLELKEKVLTQAEMLGMQSRTVWSGTAPASYIAPMADEAWPVASLEGGGGPALVWLSVDNNPPTPYLLELAAADGKVDQGSDVGEAPVWELRRRPLAGMDNDRLVLDAAGRVLRAELHTRAGAAGESLVTYRRIDRAALIRAYPALESRFKKLEAIEAKP